MSDHKMRADLTKVSEVLLPSSNVHIRGYYGDEGENEGVLSVVAMRDMTANTPDHTAIIVGSPSVSPLLPGYIPRLGGFSCSVEGAERLIAELQAAIRIVRAGYKR